MTRLIVTADDVGLHEGMTLGAIRAHREGIVTACSVAGAGAVLRHAADHLADCPELDVGIHLMLVEATPVSPPSQVPTLVTSTGTLVRNHRAFAARYALGRVSLAEVEVELRAQIERVLRHGLTPCHMNGHQHLHVLPRVFEIVVRLAHEYGIAYVRIPEDRAAGGRLSVRRAAVGVLGGLARRAAGIARQAGLSTNSCALGIATAGHLTRQRLLTLVDRVSGLTELVAHPGIDGAAISRVYDWGYEWDAETAALCDSEVLAALSRRGVRCLGVRAALATPASG